MRKLYSMRAYLTLCILAISTLIGGVSAQAQYYELVTDVNQLKDGDKCLIVNVTNKKALGSTQNNNNRSAGDVTIENDQIQTIGTDVAELTLGITEDGKYTFKAKEGYLCAANSSKNYLKSQTTLDNNGKATISITTDGSTTLKFTGNYTRNTIQYNPNNGSPIFSCYASTSQSPVVLFRLATSSDPKPTISFSETTYSVNIGQPLQLTATALLDEAAIEDGKITYSSSDTNVATIDENGNITAISEGTSTITATLEAVEGSYQSATATCELTVKDSRTAPVFSFSEESYTINVNEAKQILPTTNSNGEISYASSDDAVATVDAEGNVKGIAEGDATITATIAATNEYKAATETYQIKVVDPNKPAEVVTPMSFKKVTSTDELIEGGQYIIVCEDQNVAMTTISSNKGETTNITIKGDNSIEIETISATVNIYTMSVATDGYFQLINGDKMLSTGGVKSTNLSLTAQSSTDDNAKWKLSDNGLISKSNAESTETKRAILLNSSYLLGHYAVSNLNNGYHTTQLYRLETSATINEKIGYTTFYTDKVYQLADGMTAYTINESDEAGKVNAIEAYAAGEDVPANTALLLGGEAGTYRLPVLNKEVAAYEGENLLEGKRMADGMTRSDRENVLYYKLTTLNGENPGFYWGAEEGAAFIMKNPTTAYLAVDKAVAGANGLRLVIGESGTTGIGTVTETTQNGAIYTISGVRVNAGSTAGLPKGIYIVNGKKLLVK